MSLSQESHGAHDADSLFPQGFPVTNQVVEKASFLRIDNITLGYTFKKPNLNARVFATVSNPCVFSKYRGLDPEVFGGIDNNIYPRSMTTVIGVSMQF